VKIGGWISIMANDQSTHTLPVHDVVEHECCLECACGPRVEVYSNATSTTVPGLGWLVIHEALDSRA
jgi:hypothetical protein